MKKIKNTNFKASIIFFFTLIVIQVIYVLFSPDFKINFGAELGSIAESLIKGEGYSNPYGNTGPTAWHLPIVVLLIAATFKITGITIISFLILTIIKFLGYFICFYLVLESLTIVNQKVNIKIAFLLFLLFILFSPHQNFLIVCDLWIIGLAISAFLYSFLKFYYTESKSGYAILLLICFFTPLISPSFALGIITIISLKTIQIIYLIYKKMNLKTYMMLSKSVPDKSSKIFKKVLINYAGLLFAFIFSISIWTTRNFLVFHQIIPSKSNMWFEFYLTNVIDTDGMLSYSTSFRGHPVCSTKLQEEIRNMGEIKWVDMYYDKSVDYLKSNINNYLTKINFRLFNAFIFIENDMDKIESEVFKQLSFFDQKKLIDEVLIDEDDWISLFYSDSEMKLILSQLNLQENDQVYNDWKAAKLKFNQKKYSIPNIIRGVFMSIIPLILIIFLFLHSQYRRNPLLYLSAILYFIYLIPYILVSHQLRYQRPLFILQILIIYLFIISINNLLKISYFVNKWTFSKK